MNTDRAEYDTPDDRRVCDIEHAPLNGFPLVAAFPSMRDGEHIGPRWIVVVDRGEGTPGRYVSGWVTSLDSPEWDTGQYRANLGDAIRDALERVGYDVAPITVH